MSYVNNIKLLLLSLILCFGAVSLSATTQERAQSQEVANQKELQFKNTEDTRIDLHRRRRAQRYLGIAGIGASALCSIMTYKLYRLHIDSVANHFRFPNILDIEDILRFGGVSLLSAISVNSFIYSTKLLLKGTGVHE